MESVIAHLARKERERLRVTVVDVDERDDLAQRFRVGIVPTIALLREGRVVERVEGRMSAPKIDAVLERHLDPGSRSRAA
jgi:thioredoxin 1